MPRTLSRTQLLALRIQGTDPELKDKAACKPGALNILFREIIQRRAPLFFVKYFVTTYLYILFYPLLYTFN